MFNDYSKKLAATRIGCELFLTSDTLPDPCKDQLF